MEKQRFETLYENYHTKVYRLCLGYLGNSQSAEDLCQDIFIKIYQKYETFEQKSSIGTWIYRITANACLNELRRENKTTTQAISEKEINTTQSYPTTEKEENLQLLQFCIQKLGQIDKILITMVLEDIPYTQISETLGISEANVRVKVYRIKKELEKLFKTYQNI